MTGAVLHADVQPARRPQRLDDRDVQQHGGTATQRTCGAPGRASGRPRRGAAVAERRRALDARVQHRQPASAARATWSRSIARRRRRETACVLPGAVRRRQQLDARVPDGVRDPARCGAAQRRRGEPAGELAADQRHRGEELERTAYVNSRSFEEGSYVVWMQQPHRGLAETTLSVASTSRPDRPALRAAAAWSHGYLWGADIVQIPRARGSRQDGADQAAGRLDGGVTIARTSYYALRMNSPTRADAKRAARRRRAAKIARSRSRSAAARTRPAARSSTLAQRKKSVMRSIARRPQDRRAHVRGGVGARGPEARADSLRCRGSRARERPHAGDLGAAQPRLHRRPDPDQRRGRLNNPRLRTARRPMTWSSTRRLAARGRRRGPVDGVLRGRRRLHRDGTNGATSSPLRPGGGVDGRAAGAGRSGIVSGTTRAEGSRSSAPTGARHGDHGRDVADGGAGSFAVDGGYRRRGLRGRPVAARAQSVTAPGAALIAHGPNIAGTARLTCSRSTRSIARTGAEWRRWPRRVLGRRRARSDRAER